MPAATLSTIEVRDQAESALRAAQNLPSSTASGLGLKIRELPVAVSVIDQKEMQERGLRTALEATVTAVGVTGGILPGSIPRYSLRGFTDNNITLLRDGLKQNSIAQSSRPVDTFMLERIEVLKGPSSMMHGEGAVGGAVNYISRKPEFTRSNEAYVSLGSFGNKRGGASFTGPVNDVLAYQVTVGLIDDEGSVDRARNQQKSLSLGMRANITPQFNSLLQYDSSAERLDSWFGLPVIYDAVIDVRTGVRTVGVANTAFHSLVNPRIEPATRNFNYNLRDSYTEGKNEYLRWEASYKVNDALSVKNTAYLAKHYLNWRNSENYVWNPATRRVQRDLFHIFRNDTLTGDRLELNYKGALGSGTLLLNAGLDVNKNEVFRGLRPAGTLPASVFNVPLLSPDSGSVPAAFAKYTPSSSAEVKTRAVFLEAMLETSPGLKWFAGLRHDQLDVDRKDFVTPATSAKVSFSPTTGRVGVNWAATPEWSVYANYATSADPVNQIISVFAAQKDLPLQKGKQIELGSRLQSADGKMDATASVFNIVKTNLLINQIVSGVSVPQAVGQQSATGLELAASWRVTPNWSLDANGAYTTAQFDDFKEVVGTTTFVRDGKSPANVPKVSANLGATYKFNSNWAASAGARYVGSRFANTANLISLQAYTAVDLAAQWTSGPWNAVFRVRNATNKTYEDWAINFGLQQRLAEPRSAEVSLRYKF